MTFVTFSIALPELLVSSALAKRLVSQKPSCSSPQDSFPFYLATAFFESPVKETSHLLSNSFPTSWHMVSSRVVLPTTRPTHQSQFPLLCPLLYSPLYSPPTLPYSTLVNPQSQPPIPRSRGFSSQSRLLRSPPLAALGLDGLAIALQLLQDHDDAILGRPKQVRRVVAVDDLDQLDARPFLGGSVFSRAQTVTAAFAVAARVASRRDRVARGEQRRVLARRRRPLDGAVLEDVEDFELAHAPVRDVLVDLGDGVGDDDAVARVGDALGDLGLTATGPGELLRALLHTPFHQRQAVEVQGEIFKDGSPVAEHVVGREDAADLVGVRGLGDDECHVVLGVARRVDRLDLDPAAVAAAVVGTEALPVLHVDHAFRVEDLLGVVLWEVFVDLDVREQRFQVLDAADVVRVPVGEQRRRDGSRRRRLLNVGFLSLQCVAHVVDPCLVSLRRVDEDPSRALA